MPLPLQSQFPEMQKKMAQDFVAFMQNLGYAQGFGTEHIPIFAEAMAYMILNNFPHFILDTSGPSARWEPPTLTDDLPGGP